MTTEEAIIEALRLMDLGRYQQGYDVLADAINYCPVCKMVNGEHQPTPDEAKLMRRANKRAFLRGLANPFGIKR